jgi:hypothetical protein
MEYAQLLGKASKIASVVYKAYPKETRQFSEYRALTGKAMQLLKDGLTEAAVLNILMPVNKAESLKQKAQSRKHDAESGKYKAESLKRGERQKIDAPMPAVYYSITAPEWYPP